MLPVRTSSLLLGVNENKSSSSIHKTRDSTTSKMILRIEDFLPSENQNKNYQLINHKKPQVISLEMLKSGLASHEFSIVKLLKFQPIGKCFIRKSNDGFLHSINTDKSTIWIRTVQFSEDIYNQNAIFELTKSNKIRLRLIKDVAENEEIIGWFSEEIAMLLSIPFLTPTNIRGNNCYKCHHCNKTFESPNPLKIHITTDCDNQSVDKLWNRLNLVQKSTVAKNDTHLNVDEDDIEEDDVEEKLTLQVGTTSTMQTNANDKNFESKVPPTTIVFPTSLSSSSSSSLSLSSSFTSLSSSSLQHFYRFPQMTENFRRFSAFTPMMSSNIHHQHHHHHHRHLSSSISSSSLSSSSSTSMLQCYSNGKFIENQNQQFLCRPTQNSSEFTAINAAAQIETLVSNMSTSKQGHLCIYCGKIYSRKYGLKIHIRTHTGFKPLKCKYCLRPFGDPSNLNKHIRLHLQTARNLDNRQKNTELRRNNTNASIDLVNDHHHHQNSRYDDRMSPSSDDD